MTMFSATGNEKVFTVRYVPVVAWAFMALTAYGVSQIIGRMLSGLTPVGPGSLIALAALVGMALFVFATGGQLVVASFDRAADQVLVRRYGLRGRAVDDRRLSELVGLDVRILRRAQHRLELRFSSGERLPLTPYYVVSLNNRGLLRLGEALGLQPTIVQPRDSRG